MSVCLKLKISVTTEPIELYYSGNTPAGSVKVLSYFLGVGHPKPSPYKKRSSLPQILMLLLFLFKSKIQKIGLSKSTPLPSSLVPQEASSSVILYQYY